ncbi:MAG: hypothetical protein ABSE62_04880 [Chthoniobacteraceae bacterium]|jgi:hypothetical protein
MSLDSLTQGGTPGALLEFRALRNPRYTLMVFSFVLGQFRIQITDKEVPDTDAPEGHGGIVCEMCTYHANTMARVVRQLRMDEDPLALARSWERPWNCEGPGCRIRLDTTEADNPYRGKGRS